MTHTDPACAIPVAPEPVHLCDWQAFGMYAMCGSSIIDLAILSESVVNSEDEATCPECLSQFSERVIARRALYLFNASQPTLAGDQ